jgi:hypothetical protein
MGQRYSLFPRFHSLVFLHIASIFLQLSSFAAAFLLMLTAALQPKTSFNVLWKPADLSSSQLWVEWNSFFAPEACDGARRTDGSRTGMGVAE